MGKLFLMTIVFISTAGFSDVKYLNLELKRMPFQRDSMIPDRTKWDYEASLNFRANIKKLYIESDLTGQTSKSRFRNMWWDYTLGIVITDYLDLVWDHRSQHLLDLPKEKYDVRDSYGLRLKFIEE